MKLRIIETPDNAPELDLHLLPEIVVEDDLLDTVIQVVGDTKTQTVRELLNLPEAVAKDYADVEKMACSLYQIDYEEFVNFIQHNSLNRALHEEDYGKEKSDKFYSVLSFVDGYNKARHH